MFTVANVIVDATGFNGNLSVTDTNQQLVNKKFDDLVLSSSIAFSVAGGMNEIPFYPKNAQTFTGVTKDYGNYGFKSGQMY